MAIKVTVTPAGNCCLQNVEGTNSNIPHLNNSINFTAGVQCTFRVDNDAWDKRIRENLDILANTNIPLSDGLPVTPRTQPLLTYTLEHAPAARPVVNQVEPATSSLLDLSDAPNIVLKGTNLIPGSAATMTVGSGTSALTITAVEKGPLGNRHKVVINPGTASPSVSVSITETGFVTVTVTPAVASQANAIATQINGNTLAALFISATGGGTGKVVPQTITLTNGEGSGRAKKVFSSVSASSWLLVTANKPGNTGNAIALKINAASGGGSVSVSGTVITVTPAAGTITVSAIASQINGNASAAALVTAAATGTSNLSPAVMGPNYLKGGSGETAVATVGGATSNVVGYSDTTITLATTNAALVAAGVAAGECAMIVVLAGTQKICDIPLAVVA